MRTRILLPLIVIGAALIFVTCTKQVDYERQPENRILEYKITNLSDTVLYGVIDNIENTITVYVPFYYGMAVIDPEIMLDNGAVLEGEVLPVSVTDSTTIYTVRSSEGIARVYKLIIVQKNSVPLQLSWLVNNVFPESNFAIMGDFMGGSTETLRLYMISRANGDTVLPDQNRPITIRLNTTTPDYPYAYILTAYLPVSIDSGYYDVQMQYLGRLETVEEPLHVSYQVPAIAPVWSPVTVSPGGEISFNASTGRQLIDPLSVQVTIDGNVFDMQILSHSTRKTLYVKLPENVPAGDHGTVPFRFQFGAWNPITFNMPIIISAE